MLKEFINHYLVKNWIPALLMTLFVMFWISNASAQSLQGKVRDKETRKELVNVNLVIIGTSLGAVSDENGEFEIKGLIAGKYTLKASMMGYKSVEIPVTIAPSKHTALSIELVPTVLQMKTVAVTGERERNVIKQPEMESPALQPAISSITRRELTRQGAKTLIDALTYIPGAWIESRGRKVKQFFSIRGQKYPYPEYALNGTWQREFHELPYFFSSADVERIEVIRSSAALLTGLSGMAGVINVTTRDFDHLHGAWEIEYGTFGTYRSHFSHGNKVGELSYATGLGIQGTSGPVNRHATEKMLSLYSRLNWQATSKMDVKLNVFHLNGIREIAQAEPPAAKSFQTAIESYNPLRATLTNAKVFYHPNDKYSTELLIYHALREPLYVDEDEVTHMITKTSERDYEFGFNLLQSIALSEDNKLRIGGLFNRWVAPNGKRFYVGRRCDLATYSAVIVDEHHFGALSLDAGLRWSKTYIDEYGAFNISGSARGFQKVAAVTDVWEPAMVNASLGITYKLSSWQSLHINLAGGQILPRRGTLDVNLQVPAAENRYKLDVSLQTTWPDLGQFSIVGFATRQDNAIALSGQTQEMNGRIMELYMNRDHEQIGLEIEARSSSLWNLMEVFLNSVAMASRVDLAGKMERNQELPQFIHAMGLYFSRSRFDFNFLLKYISAYQSTRFAADTTIPHPLGDFLVMNSTLGWTLDKNQKIRLYCEVLNLTNQKYSTVVGYPDFGRRINVGISQRIW